ncbi:MAG: hypothetical protein LH645_02395 [Actinomycetia bacterium]|nr:hypothetical protein [Actinomycetes bacterium]
MRTVYSRIRADETGSIVFGWLGRITFTLVVLGLICFEVLSIVVTRVGLEDVGQTAGDRALTIYAESKNPNSAYLAADEYAASQGAALVKKSFTISAEAVSFDLEKTAPTLLLYRLDATAKFADVKTTIYAEPFVQSGSSP